MHLPMVNVTRKYVANIIFRLHCVEPPIVPNALESLFHFLTLILKFRLKNPMACNSFLENLGYRALL